ncbi:MAG: oligosaccharide flippase family protein [Sedimentitalea sp.]
MIRTAVLLLSGNAFGWLFLFARNLVIARLISVEDYGIAATFALSMAVVEMASGLGVQQLIVQDKNGEDPDFQAGLQGFHLLRSVISAVFLFAMAHPIALFLGVQDIAWAYQVLAVIPLLRGFEHFDMHRLNRQNIYYPILLHTAVPAVISLATVWPLNHWFGDYRVMLYAMLVQWSLGVVVSHAVAKRSYRLSFARDIIRQCLQFGWPILISNVLLFFVLQGDKAIVGRELGMESLAIFAMGVTLTMVPVLIVAKSLQMFFLPRLSAAQDDPVRFQHLTMAAMQASLLSGLLLIAGTMVLGAPMIWLLLGDKYSALIPLIVWLAIQQATRSFKVGSTIAALAQKHTSNAMIANIVRLLVLPAVWYVAATGGRLEWIVMISIVGELMSYFTSLWLVRNRLNIALGDMVWPILTVLACVAVIAGVGPLAQATQISLPVWHAVLVAALIPVFLSMRQLRVYVLPARLSQS